MLFFQFRRAAFIWNVFCKIVNVLYCPKTSERSRSVYQNLNLQLLQTAHKHWPKGQMTANQSRNPFTISGQQIKLSSSYYLGTSGHDRIFLEAGSLQWRKWLPDWYPWADAFTDAHRRGWRVFGWERTCPLRHGLPAEFSFNSPQTN